MAKDKEKRNIQFSVQVTQSFYDFLEHSAKIKNKKFKPASEMYELGLEYQSFLKDSNSIDFQKLYDLQNYEKELNQKSKDIEDALVIVKSLRKVGKSIKLSDY
jgi:hypothetical protein